MGVTLRSTGVHLDLLVDPFDAEWSQVRDLALAAEERGWSGVWTWDHLSGTTHDQDHVLEGWTVLSALAAVTSRVALGPLVLNPANRDASLVAQMAATLQDVSGGRLLLGIGAGTGPTGAYAAEQYAVGRTPAHDPERRDALVEYVGTLRQAWTGTLGGLGGFLPPDPPPPVVVAAFGPKLGAIAGQVGDGLNTHAALPGLEALVDVARSSSREPDAYLVTAFAGIAPAWLDPDSPERRRLAAVGCDRLQLVVRPHDDPESLPEVGNR
jgi:alkanesulfonate monooxygenase SsuD/methylene tetrahydromethanopterin reductase-like flavin-dependent oxidoreductase (luciferase family)